MPWPWEGRLGCASTALPAQGLCRERARARVVANQGRKRNTCVISPFTLIINESVNVSKGFLSCANLQRM